MKLYFIILFSLCTLCSFSQDIVDIPDPNFKQALIDEGVDTNGDGEIQVSEAEVVNIINVANKEIESLVGIEAFVNLVELDCSLNSLSSLDVSHNTNLEILNCWRNSLTELNVSQNGILEYLSCSVNSLTELDISHNENLFELDCVKNYLTELNISHNANLKTLDCSQNSLTELDVTQNPNLEELNCSNNSLTSLDVNHNENLFELRCDYNSLTELSVSLNNLLKTLDCGNNPLMELDISPNTDLRYLNCSSNSLTELDVSHNYFLSTLICSNNSLTKLEVSQNEFLTTLNSSSNPLHELDVIENNSLENLICISNSLVELNISQNTKLRFLDCYSNALTSLDITQNVNLFELRCDGNSLTELNASQNTNLRNLWCNDNPLQFLNMYNGSVISYLRTYNNADLLTICLDEEEIEYVKSVVSQDSVVLVTDCDLAFGGDLYEITGAVTYSSESDCSDIQDTLTGFHFEIKNGNSFLYRPTYTNDKYLMRLPEDMYSISLEIENSELFHFTPDTALIELNSTSSPYLQDFCIWPIDSACVDIDITILPLDQARPGFEVDYKLIYENQGNKSSSGIIQIDYPEDISTFIGATPNLIDDQGVLSFGYSDLKPFEEREIYFTMKLNSPMDNPPLTGGRISYTAQITPDEKEYYLPNNEFVLMQDVVNSYDPNDKTCLQGTTLLDNMVGDYVDYLIRFENTGTADAVNITILDEINPEVFDINSLHVTDSSHPVFARTDGDVVQFVFQDIYLPYQESDNKGYVAYKIKTWDHLQVGDSLKNTANIYFDFNYPITTNTTVTTVVTDMDDDGYHNLEDCDDSNANVNPSQVEEPYNGVDDDCNPETLDDDLDQDGYLLIEDCNDNNASIHPNAEEVCDDNDNNCDGNIDEGLEFITYYTDNDGDGFGDELTAIDHCTEQDGLVIQSGDCDDTNPDINPNTEDIPNNGIDEDCDGMDAISNITELSEIGIQVYPNPAKDYLIIQNPLQKELKVELISILGEILNKTSFDSLSFPLSLDDVSNGSYILRLAIEDKIYFVKILKI